MRRQRWTFAARMILMAALVAALWTGFGCAARPPEVTIENPYATVDWEKDGRYKTNFHTHTTRSDGCLNPHEVVDRYHKLGYSVLALTDHNEVTYPWTRFSTLSPSAGSVKNLAANRLETDSLAYQDREPDALNMTAVQGNELSRHHHMGSYFTDHNGTQTAEESLDAVSAKDGLAVLFHPGRYKQPVEWYVALYRKYPCLVGLEVFNQGDRYPNDRKTWDAILTDLMPDRPVWGFSNDDLHSRAHLGRNWAVLLLPDRSESQVRRAMERGLFYFVHAPQGHEGPPPPIIRRIVVDAARASITLAVSGEARVEWISRGEVIHRGATLNLAQLPAVDGYVRAEVRAPEGGPVAGTQPFGIRRRTPAIPGT